MLPTLHLTPCFLNCGAQVAGLGLSSGPEPHLLPRRRLLPVGGHRPPAVDAAGLLQALRPPPGTHQKHGGSGRGVSTWNISGNPGPRTIGRAKRWGAQLWVLGHFRSLGVQQSSQAGMFLSCSPQTWAVFQEPRESECRQPESSTSSLAPLSPAGLSLEGKFL